MQRRITAFVLLLFASLLLPRSAPAEDCGGTSAVYRALVHRPAAPGTWALLERDGANRVVDRYLSSLGAGEFGTGTIVSPAFRVGVDTIAFTVCGHDGPGGGAKKNFVALADAKTGDILRKTHAPGSDSMAERSWNVQDLRGRTVQVKLSDGIAAGGFAWLGVGRIDAGVALRLDFTQVTPDGWTESTPPGETKTVLVEGGIPFRALRSSMVRPGGATKIDCGFRARRVFFLGCTVARGRPLEVGGQIVMRYRSGQEDRLPLLVGFTLDGEFKLLSSSPAMRLHPSGDPFQYYLPVELRDDVLEWVRIEASGGRSGVPSITAITCETGSKSERLEDLPDCQPGEDEARWIASHSVSPERLDMKEVEDAIRSAHGL